MLRKAVIDAQHESELLKAQQVGISQTRVIAELDRHTMEMQKLAADHNGKLKDEDTRYKEKLAKLLANGLEGVKKLEERVHGMVAEIAADEWSGKLEDDRMDSHSVAGSAATSMVMVQNQNAAMPPIDEDAASNTSLNEGFDKLSAGKSIASQWHVTGETGITINRFTVSELQSESGSETVMSCSAAAREEDDEPVTSCAAEVVEAETVNVKNPTTNVFEAGYPLQSVKKSDTNTVNDATHLNRVPNSVVQSRVRAAGFSIPGPSPGPGQGSNKIPMDHCVPAVSQWKSTALGHSQLSDFSSLCVPPQGESGWLSEQSADQEEAGVSTESTQGNQGVENTVAEVNTPAKAGPKSRAQAAGPISLAGAEVKSEWAIVLSYIRILSQLLLLLFMMVRSARARH